MPKDRIKSIREGKARITVDQAEPHKIITPLRCGEWKRNRENNCDDKLEVDTIPLPHKNFFLGLLGVKSKNPKCTYCHTATNRLVLWKRRITLGANEERFEDIWVADDVYGFLCPRCGNHWEVSSWFRYGY